MDYNATRSCFWILLLAVVAGCSAKSEVTDVPEPRVDSPRTVDVAKTDQPQAKSSGTKSSWQDGDIIDLAARAKSVKEYLRASIARFAAEHPDTEVSCIALYFSSYGRNVYINYETRTHSDASVKKYQESKDRSYAIGRDAGGLFNKLPNDFQFAQHDRYTVQGMPKLSDAKWPVKFRGLDGKVKESDSYDEDVGRVLLDSYEPALKSFNEFGKLKRSDIFRMGISIHNARCEAFWLHPEIRSLDK